MFTAIAISLAGCALSVALAVALLRKQDDSITVGTVVRVAIVAVVSLALTFWSCAAFLAAARR